MIDLALIGSVREAGAEWDALFEAGPGLQSRRVWFEAVEAGALRAGGSAVYALLRAGGTPVGLVPLLRGPGRLMSGLTCPYTVLFQPLLAPEADAAEVGAVLGRYLRGWPVTLLDALDPQWAPLGGVLKGFGRAGLLAHRFDQFGNWYEDVAGLDWNGYLARRPGALRETIRRKSAAAGRDASIRFAMTRTPDGLDAAIAAYEHVYARSWKSAETHPGFTAALLHRIAPMGTLRLSVMWQGDTPVAAQYWTVQGGEAMVLKLAHDDTAKVFSPGTLLTAFTIRMLLEQDELQWLDFGRGDDPYKRHWTTLRRQRIGVMLANPLHPAGLMAAARHQMGVVLRRWRRRSSTTP